MRRQRSNFLSTFLAFIFLVTLVSSNQDFFPIISIIDGDKVNALGTYRIQLLRIFDESPTTFPSGAIFKIYIPSSLTMQTTSGTAVSVCRRYISDEEPKTPYSSCSYSSGVLQFSLSAQETFDYQYGFEIGLIKNPGSAVPLSGFRIVVETSSGTNLQDITQGEDSPLYIQPSSLTGQSVASSSAKVADYSTYTFKFQISNDVPGDGKIEITFPTSEIDLPLSLASSDTRVKIYDRAQVTGSIQIRTSGVITFNNPFSGLAQSPDSSKYIEIQIDKIQNPKSLKETASFSIQTTDNSDYIIDQVMSGLTVQMTAPADIIPSSDTPRNLVAQVNAITIIQFTITLPITYDSGGYLLITFPTESKILSNFICNFVFGFSSTSNPCQLISSSPQVVKISNPVNNQRLIFQIGSVQNPSTNKPTSTFKIEAYNSQNYVICSRSTGLTYTATPANINTVSATRSLSEINILNDNSLTISFTAISALVSGEQIYLKIPYDQMVTDSSTFACSVASGTNALTTTSCSLDTSSNSNYFILSMVAPCASNCAAGTQFTVKLTGVRNPGWKVSPQTKSVELYLMTSDLLWIKDRKITNLYTTPELTEGHMTGLSIAKVGYIVNQPTELITSFTIKNTIPNNGLIRILLPSNSFYPPKTGTVTCQDLITSSVIACTVVSNTDSTKGLDYIQFATKCTSSCPAGTSMTFKVENLLNRPSIRTIPNSFTIRSYTQELYYIDIGTVTDATGLELQAAAFTQIQLTSPVAPIVTGQIGTSYIFKVTSSNGIEKANLGYMQIAFPSEVKLMTASPACSASVSSVALSCEINTSTQKVLIKNSESASNYDDQIITVTLNGVVRNPQTTKPSSKFEVSTYLYDSEMAQNYLVDHDKQSLSVTAETPNQLTSVTVTRSEIIINQATDFTLTFTIFNPIPLGSTISIAIPKDQVVITDSTVRVFKDASTNTVLIEAASVQGINDSSATHVTVILNEWCGSNECTAGSIISIKFSGANNPKSTRSPSQSFQFVIKTSEGYYTDQKTTDIQATPFVSAGPFQSLALSESSGIVGDPVIMTILAKLSNEITVGHTGKFKVQIPSMMYYTALDSANELICKSGGVVVACSGTTQTSTIGTYYTIFQISLNCLSESCSSGTERIFTIENIRNHLSTQPMSGTITISTIDDEEYSFDSTSQQVSATGLSTILAVNQQGLMQTFERSSAVVSDTIDLTMTFKLAVRLAKNSQIQVYIPKQQFLKSASASPICSNGENSETFDCTYSSSDSFYHVIQFKEYCTQTDFCPEEYSFSLKISGFSNRYNTKSGTDKVQFKTFTYDSYSIEESVNSLLPSDNLVASTSTILSDYSLSDDKVGQNTKLTLNILPQNTFLTGDLALISFSVPIFKPSTSSTSPCTLKSASTQLLDSTCTSQLSNGYVTSILLLLPFDQTKVESLTFELLNIVNLDEDRPWSTTISLLMYTQEEDTQQYEIAKGEISIVDNDILKPMEYQVLEVRRDYAQLKDVINLSVKYQSSIAIMANSYIKIQIPKNQAVINSAISCKYQNVDIVCTQIDDNTDYIVLTTEKTLCATENSCPKQTDQILTIQGLRNPDYRAVDIKTFIVQHISINDYSILSSEGTNVVAIPYLQLKMLKNLIIEQSLSDQTNMPTAYNLYFKLPQTYESGYKLLLILPEATVLQSDNEALPDVICFSNQTLINYTCEVHKITNGFITQIMITDFCVKEDSCSLNSQHQIHIYNINNVYYARTRNQELTIQIVTPENYVTAESFYSEQNLLQFRPRVLDTFTVERETSSPGQTYLDLTLSFVTPNKIPNGSFLKYFIPHEQVVLPKSSELTCVAASIIRAGTDLKCQTIFTNETYTILLISEWCSGDCSIGTQLSMKILNTANPTTLETNDPTYSFGVHVQTDGMDSIEEVYSNITAQPLLDAIQINEPFISRDLNILGSNDNLTVMFTLGETIAVKSNLSFTLPVNTSYLLDGQIPSCVVFKDSIWQEMPCTSNFYENYPAFGLAPLKNVTIYDFCSPLKPCNPDEIIIIKFAVSNPRSNFNQYSLNNSAWFSITLKGIAKDYARIRYRYNLTQLQSNEITASITQNESCSATGKVCSMQIAMQTSNPFIAASDQYLELTFPESLSVLSTSQCTVLLNINLTMQCRLLTDKVIQLRHTFNFTDQQYSDMNQQFQILLSLSQVGMPPSNEESGSFQIKTVQYENKTDRLVIDEIKHALTMRVESISQFSSINITRSVTLAGNRTKLSFEMIIDNVTPKDAIFELYFSENQALIEVPNGVTPTCLSPQSTIFNQKTISCKVIDSQTLSISGLCTPNGCSAGSKLQFNIGESIVMNPTSIRMPVSDTEDSVKIRSYYLKNGTQYSQQSNNEKLFILPEIEGALMIENGLVVIEQSYYTDQLSELQVMSFKAKYGQSTFSKDTLRLQFLNVSFIIDPFYKIEVTINKQTSKMKIIQTTDFDGNPILDTVYLECGIKCLGKSELFIEIIGFRNAYSRNTNSNTAIRSLPRMQFAELEAYPSTVLSSSTLILSGYLSNIASNQFKNQQVKLGNYRPNATNNSIELLFTLKNNPQIEQNATITVQLPSNFKASKPICKTLFTNQSLSCSASKNGTINISGYFNQTIAQVQKLRRLLQSTSSQDNLENTVVALNITNVTNPSNQSYNQPTDVSIESGPRLYAMDRQSMFLTVMETQGSGCYQNETCAECSQSDNKQCTQCVTPSKQPLLQNGTCKERCDSGYFEHNQQCYRCAYGCKECQTYDQCTACDNKTQILIDGKCVERVNSVNQTYSCPEGTYKNAEYGCVTSQGCTQADCKLCGYDKDYCHQCQAGETSLNGQCTNTCPEGYTNNTKGQCMKCDSVCGTCEEDTKQCTSCRYDFYEQVVLDYALNTCASSCSISSLQRANDSLFCDACKNGCYSCSKSLDICDSCHYDKSTNSDLFLYEGQCVSSCPSGLCENYDTHQCEISNFNSGFIIYLVLVLFLVSLLILISRFLTGKKDNPLDILLALLTQFEAINRFIIIIAIWHSQHLFAFCVTGMNVLINVLLTMYMVEVLLHPISKSLKFMPKDSKAYSFTVTLSQFSGVNTLRILSSRFLNVKAFSIEKLLTLVQYVKYIETISAMTTVFNVFQFLVGITLVTQFDQGHLGFGFGINSIVFNTILISGQVHRFREYQQYMREYNKVANQEQR